MAARSTSPKSSATEAELTRQLEKLDRELLKALGERAKCFERLAKLRPELADAPLDRERIETLVAASKGPLAPEILRVILSAIESGSRALVHRVRVAYLGPAHSYSHLAALRAFGEGQELLPVSTIRAVFEEVNRRQVSYGVVPLENSTDGRIADTLDMFVRMPVTICGEVQLRIHHYLLSRSPRSEIMEVYSKPQALSQCRDWLARHLPQARLIEMTSTTAAAQVAADRPGAAAIAGRQAGIEYGLDVVEADIEDNRSNTTRFAIIGQQPPPRSGHDKTALMIEIAHRPGALAETMAVFRTHQLNLTWIESFPMPGSKNEYLFFVEVEGHEKHPKLQKALASLHRRTARTVLLGSYPKSEPVE